MQCNKSTCWAFLVLPILAAGGMAHALAREQIEWSEFWWQNEPDTTKPRLLFVGDSITKGYFPMVASNLAGEVNCDRYVSSRSIVDPALLGETKMAMGGYHHAVIYFNNGLHGWHLDSAQYEEGLRRYTRFLMQHKVKDCQLVYALTTPVPSKEKGLKLAPDRNHVVMERNRIARRIMQENSIPVIDLYGLMAPDIEKYSDSKGNVHYNRQGCQRLASRIAEVIADLLKENTAVIPVSKLENDSYDWWARHAEALRIKNAIDPEIVLIGDSITHFWGGRPTIRYADGTPRKPNGPRSWDSVFAGHRVLNLGFGWDRTQNVLWRLDHGELEDLSPRLVIIHIGTNNTSETANARTNTASEIAQGVEAVCRKVRSKVGRASVVLMAIFPREQYPHHPRRRLINAANRLLKTWANEQGIAFLDIGPGMLTPDGVLSKEIASGFCHPTDKGCQIWADAIRPFVEKAVR